LLSGSEGGSSTLLTCSGFAQPYFTQLTQLTQPSLIPFTSLLMTSKSPPPAPQKPKLHIVGAGWAGLSAAVHATLKGWQVHLYEAAPEAGGRARGITHQGRELDNGQHLLLGAYQETLSLMTTVGVAPEQVLQRRPLELCNAQGEGLRLHPVNSRMGLLGALWAIPHWDGRDRLSLLSMVGWVALWHGLLQRGFMHRDKSVSWLCAMASERVMNELVSPLCLAALNTPPQEASARVFSQVLMDAFSDPPHSCDFLLPKVNLSALFPTPAIRWLQSRGASLSFGHLIKSLSDLPRQPNEPVILATSAWQAAHLSRELNPEWSKCAQALKHYPIATVYVSAWDPTGVAGTSSASSGSSGSSSPLGPVVRLDSGLEAPAQFAILTPFECPQALSDELNALADSAAFPALRQASLEDRKALDSRDNAQWQPELFSGNAQARCIWAMVVSDSRDLTRETLIEQTLRQAQNDLGLIDPKLEGCILEKRATFAALVGQARPALKVAQGVWACGDYVLGPYPSTLEGAVLSGKNVVNLLDSPAYQG
jgi:hydroxysqualene dehydroxylase